MTDISPLLFDNKHYVQKIEVVELQINKVAPPPQKKSVWLYRKNVKFFMITKLLKKQKNMKCFSMRVLSNTATQLFRISMKS